MRKRDVVIVLIGGVVILTLVSCFFVYAENKAHGRDYMDDPI